MKEEQISVFDIFKIGAGPSSSHTLGPWRAAQQFLNLVGERTNLSDVDEVSIHLYGSLSKTGKGHGTDIAVILGLAGYDPVTIDTSQITPVLADIASEKKLLLGGLQSIHFEPARNMVFHLTESLPFHPNGLTFCAEYPDGTIEAGLAFNIPISLSEC